MSGQIDLIPPRLRPVSDLAHEARVILSAAIEEHDPVAIYVALSGGNDSRCMADVSLPVLANDPRFRGALLVDTGIAIPEAHDNVREHAAGLGVSLTIQEPLRPGEYERFVLAHGFPGPAQHHRMYQQLKERGLERRVAIEKQGHSRRARVLFVSGVRKYESKRRVRLTEPTTRRGGQAWVNPMFYWTTPERDAYQQARGIERNPISEIICGSSGDCLCGAMADPDADKEMESFRIWFPDTYRRLRDLERQAERAGVHCRWGHKPPPKPDAVDTETHDLFMPMCVGCERRVA